MTDLEIAIFERLKTVIDPETNIDVVRMRLVENLWADTLGKVRYTFRPSSFVCPISLPDKIRVIMLEVSKRNRDGQVEIQEMLKYAQAELKQA